jgi:hypothetical protein
MHGISGQFLGEGIIAGALFSLAGVAFTCGLYVLSKPQGSQLTTMEDILRKFSFSAPVWCFLAYRLFALKIGSFRPGFRP